MQLTDMLPSKMAPTKRTKLVTHPKQQADRPSVRVSKKSRKVTVEEVEDDDGHRNILAHDRASSPGPPTITETAVRNTQERKKVSVLMASPALLSMSAPQKPGGARCVNPIYLFYELVPQNASGSAGDPGDKHYRCCHGNQKILTVTKAMKSNLNGS